jgi:hypothetical protein
MAKGKDETTQIPKETTVQSLQMSSVECVPEAN